MTCTVKVANGAIPLPPGVELPDGSEVQLIVPDPVTQPASFADRYAAYIGAGGRFASRFVGESGSLHPRTQ